MDVSQLNQLSKSGQEDLTDEIPERQNQPQRQTNQTNANTQFQEYDDESDNEINNSNRDTSNRFNDTDELVNHLERENANLVSEKMRLQQDLINSIEQLLNEQNQLRAQLNLPPNDHAENQDSLRQYPLDQLAEYKQKIQEFNQSLIKEINKAKNSSTSNVNNFKNMNTSDVLRQEKDRNKNLKRELKKLKEAQNKMLLNNEINNEDNNVFTDDINELQQENQRLSREMIKSKSQFHRNQSQEFEDQTNNQRRSQRDYEYDIDSAVNELQQENQRISREMQKAKRRHHHNPNQEIPKQTSNQRKRQNNYSNSNSSDNIDQRPPDPNKIHLAEQLMAENALLRNTLGLDPLNYHAIENFSSTDVDKIIAQLLDHNKIMREQVSQQSQTKNGMKKLKRPIQTQQMARYLQYLDLQGSREGCTFWVPLDAKKQKEQQDYYNDMQMRLPIPVEKDTDKKKKKYLKGCSKCEKAILMMSRVPLYPQDASKIIEGSDEFQLVESWIITSLNKKVRLTDVIKSSFFYKIIENERTMNNIHLFVITTDDPMQYLTEGIDQPILLADHFKYVDRELNQKGSANILICAFDVGNQATNFCEHTIIPNIQEMKSTNPSFDSLRFRYQKEEAVMALNPSRIVPIYAVQINNID